MTKSSEIGEFLARRKHGNLLDIRSPSEFNSGHIPGAISFPLFDDDERAEVGTIYKRDGNKEAVKRGLEIVGPKMIEFVEEAEKLNSNSLLLYCWRGGMRSQSMAWLLQQVGIKTTLLTGGYKSYRRLLMNFFKQKLPLQVVSGYTGSRKTELLHMLKNHGEQVIDLEGLAQHQGSSFGNAKSVEQPTTEQFQNLVFEQFSKMDIEQPIWIEDESMTIGRVCMVEDLHSQKNISPHFLIEIDKKERVEFLMKEYGSISNEKLIGATRSIGKKLGVQKMIDAIDCIKGGDLRAAAEIILTYYDKQYLKAIERKAEYIHDRYSLKMSELEEFSRKLTKESLHEL